MINNKKILVVIPAYNSAKNIKKTYNEIDFEIVDDVILVDDFSTDETISLAKTIGIKNIIKHDKNLGYGANQKTCYKKALELKADIVIMLHPDYQYTPKLIPSISYMIANDIYSVVLGSRFLSKGTLKGGMPLYKYIANRFLTIFQNFLLNHNLSEYHTGYRAFSSKVLKEINFEINSNDFIFDNQMLSQIIFKNYKVGEISCPTKYFKESSSINFKRSVIYGLGVIMNSIKYFCSKNNIYKFKIYR